MIKITTKQHSTLLSLPKGSKTGLHCEVCGAELVIRVGSTKFLGCSNYPKCTNHYSLVNNTRSMSHNLPDIDVENYLDFSTPSEFVPYDVYDPPILCKDDM